MMKKIIFIFLIILSASLFGGSKMTFNAGNITSFGTSKKTMKLWEKTDNVEGNENTETNEANLNDLNDVVFPLASNIQYIYNKMTTEDVDVHFTDFATLQAFVSSLEQVNNNVLITIDGSGYAGNNLVFSNTFGSGTITLAKGTATDKFASVTVNNVATPLILSGIETDTGDGFSFIDSNQVDMNNCLVANAGNAIDATNSKIMVSNIKIGVGVATLAVSSLNSKVFINSIDPTSADISAEVFIAHSGGEIHKPETLNLFTTGSVFEQVYNSGKIFGFWGYSQTIKTGTAYTTKTLNLTGLTTEQANQAILNVGSNIPKNAILQISLPTATLTGTNPITISNFYGGGEIIFSGNGAGSIIPAILIEENRVRIKLYNFKVEGSTATRPLVDVKHNTKYINIETVYTNENSGGSAVEANFNVNACPLVVIQTSQATGKIGINAEWQAHVWSRDNVNFSTPSTDYGLQATSAAVITKTGTQPGGTIANENAVTGGIIR